MSALPDADATGLEQVGLAQKGGPVVSDVRIAKNPVSGSLRASCGTADVLIGFDPLGAAAHVSTELPTLCLLTDSRGTPARRCR